MEVVHLHQLLAEPVAMRGLKTLNCSLICPRQVLKLSLPDPPHGVAHAVQGGGEGGEARHAGDHGEHEPADQSELSIVTIDQSQLT